MTIPDKPVGSLPWRAEDISLQVGATGLPCHVIAPLGQSLIQLAVDLDYHVTSNEDLYKIAVVMETLKDVGGCLAELSRITPGQSCADA